MESKVCQRCGGSVPLDRVWAAPSEREEALQHSRPGVPHGACSFSPARGERRAWELCCDQHGSFPPRTRGGTTMMTDDHATCTACGDGLLPEDARDGGAYGLGPLCPECYGLETALR